MSKTISRDEDERNAEQRQAFIVSKLQLTVAALGLGALLLAQIVTVAVAFTRLQSSDETQNKVIEELRAVTVPALRVEVAEAQKVNRSFDTRLTEISVNMQYLLEANGLKYKQVK